MSGWIKLEKDLTTDIRIRRMAKALAEADGLEVTHVRFNLAQHVTHVIGGLAVLWIYADTHIRTDDTLDVGRDEIDEIVGIPGFARILAADWLEEIDAHTVKLPGFQEHNGIEAKKKALAARRVAKHRAKTVTGERYTEGEDGNADALPDQDQTKTKTRPSEEARATPPKPAEPEAAIRTHVEAIKAIYPKGGRADWITAEKAMRRIVSDGEGTWEALIAGTRRYATYCAQTGRLVGNPARFFTDIDQPWAQPWEPPAPKPKPGEKPPRDLSAVWAEARAAGRDIGFREPYPQESPEAYMTQVKFARDGAPRKAPEAVAAVAARMRVAR